MYCTKCKFTSFDHIPSCPKCGYDWQRNRTALNLAWLQSAGHGWLSETAPSSPGEASAASPGSPSGPSSESHRGVSSEEKDAIDLTSLSSIFEPSEAFEFQEEGQGLVQSSSGQSTSQEQPIKRRSSLFPEKIPENAPITQEDYQTDGGGIGNLEAQAMPVVPPAGSDFAPESASPAARSKEPEASQTGRHQGEKQGEQQAEDELPVWEIELPEDLLSSDFFPEPSDERKQAKSPGSVTKKASPATSEEEFGDIVYDFAELDAVLGETENLAGDKKDRPGTSPAKPGGKGQG